MTTSGMEDGPMQDLGRMGGAAHIETSCGMEWVRVHKLMGVFLKMPFP